MEGGRGMVQGNGMWKDSVWRCVLGDGVGWKLHCRVMFKNAVIVVPRSTKLPHPVGHLQRSHHSHSRLIPPVLYAHILSFHVIPGGRLNCCAAAA